MKVYFGTSVRGDLVRARKIDQTIKKLGYKTTSKIWDTDIPEKFYSMSLEDRARLLPEAYKSIASADVALMEVSLPSFTIGQFIRYALDHKIPVLAIHRKGSPVAPLEGQGQLTERMLIVEYEENNLGTVIKEGIEYLRALSQTRFTMIFPIKIMRYLDNISKQGLSRSEYIRRLIENDMKKFEG